MDTKRVLHAIERRRAGWLWVPNVRLLSPPPSLFYLVPELDASTSASERLRPCSEPPWPAGVKLTRMARLTDVLFGTGVLPKPRIMLC